jgi:hypothetical protein
MPASERLPLLLKQVTLRAAMQDEQQIKCISACKDVRDMLLKFAENTGLPVTFLKQTNSWETMSENSSEKPSVLSNSTHVLLNVVCFYST